MAGDRVTASIVGASGYTGGELLRLLLGHPHIEIKQVTSERLDGQFVHFTHPNLRSAPAAGRAPLKFTASAALEPCGLLFLCLPHGGAMGRIESFASLAPRIVDLSADFRLREPRATTAGTARPTPTRRGWRDFVYGLPELHRDAIAGASYVSGVGCNATATTLAIWPLAKAGLLDASRGIICEVKVGSSEGGAASSDSTHHPERAGVMRSFAPTGHRHTAEVLQALALAQREDRGPPERDGRRQRPRRAGDGTRLRPRGGGRAGSLEGLSRRVYGREPFVRIVKERAGLYRYPEPKILSGSNYADVGFEFDASTRRVVALCAIDNLMKGAAGTALQCANLDVRLG